MEDIPHDPHHVGPALARREIFFRPVGEDDEPHLVIVLDGRKGENRCDLAGYLGLGLLEAAERFGAREINHQHNGELPLFYEFLDKGLSQDGPSRSSR